MKKIRTFSRSPMGTMLMFMVAILLLMTGTIGGVRATPQIFNREFFYGGLQLDEIGITLVENGKDVSKRDYNSTEQEFDVWTNSDKWSTDERKVGALLENMLPEVDGKKEKLKLGYAYPEELKVRNSGGEKSEDNQRGIPEYVRVTIYKYWLIDENKDGLIDKNEDERFRVFDEQGHEAVITDKNGNQLELNDLIDLHFVTGNGWVIDHSSDTKERTVLYYTKKLAPGETSSAFTDTIRINDKIMDYATVRTETEGNTVTWTADGMTFMIEASADGVQDHNARAAMKSAWGLTDAQINAYYGANFN